MYNLKLPLRPIISIYPSGNDIPYLRNVNFISNYYSQEFQLSGTIFFYLILVPFKPNFFQVWISNNLIKRPLNYGCLTMSSIIPRKRPVFSL